MEKLRGGFLARPPARVRDVFTAAPVQKSPVEWALDYLWNKPEISVVLSGMSSMEMVRENLAYAEKAHPGMLSAAERKTLAMARDAFKTYDVIPCTGCSYCSICPKGVAIPKCFEVYNRWKMQGGEPEEYRTYYAEYVSNWGNPASACVHCHSCEKVCPQHLKIPELLGDVASLFEQD